MIEFGLLVGAFCGGAAIATLVWALVERRREVEDVLRLVRTVKEREVYIDELTEHIAMLEDERMK